MDCQFPELSDGCDIGLSPTAWIDLDRFGRGPLQSAAPELYWFMLAHPTSSTSSIYQSTISPTFSLTFTCLAKDWWIGCTGLYVFFVWIVLIPLIPACFARNHPLIPVVWPSSKLDLAHSLFRADFSQNWTLIQAITLSIAKFSAFISYLTVCVCFVT